jgi:hypothetical protein
MVIHQEILVCSVLLFCRLMRKVVHLVSGHQTGTSGLLIDVFIGHSVRSLVRRSIGPLITSPHAVPDEEARLMLVQRLESVFILQGC